MVKHLLAPVAGLLLFGCTATQSDLDKKEDKMTIQGKPVVYQVFTRLFGNQNTTNVPWGTIEQNGVGKFNDFTDVALSEIQKLGVSHVWYTGVLHHAVVNDYTDIGIGLDDPDVVKGRAGSPYAIKDYYSVNPDLAVNPANRLAEFEALIVRTHKHNMKVIIDIVPNHVARGYQSIAKPQGVEDFGASDDKSVEYARDNNFYYVFVDGKPKGFEVPIATNGYQPLGGEAHPLADGKFDEFPAKWTGNGARAARPDINDWYETVKVNFGVKPDGSYDFDKLPADYATKDYRQHAAFWQGKSVPSSWIKFRQIAEYWLAKGVDGFRYDMAEMVPVEFWSYMNSSIKMVNPDAFLLAEVYNPSLFRDYIHLGKMDYLYDKVDFYDTLKDIMRGKKPASSLLTVVNNVTDIDSHMLHFMENHDEQRINTADFAGSAEAGMPGMVVSTTMTTSPTMLYFGQDVGEAGELDSGFGDPTRTTIFDYAGVPAHQRWMNNGAFDGGQSTAAELALQAFYRKLMTFSAQSDALNGHYAETHQYNLHNASGYSEQQLSFVRWSKNNDEKVIVISNFVADAQFDFQLSSEIVTAWQLEDGTYQFNDALSGSEAEMKVANGVGVMAIKLPKFGSVILTLR